MKTDTIKEPKAKKVKQEPKESKEVAIIQKKEMTLSLGNPADVMEFGKVLKKYIIDNGLSVNIGGNDYAMVDAWKFAGLNFGLTAIPRKPVKISERGEYIKVIFINKEFKSKDGTKSWVKEVIDWIGFAGDLDAIETARKDIEARKTTITKEQTKPYFAYECECDIKRLSDGMIINYGEGFCSNLESLKAGFDEYSVNSMSQTRSIGKAYRNLLGYVMKSAGYEPTPAEEMEQSAENQKEEKKEAKKPGKEKPEGERWEKVKLRFAKGGVSIEEVKKHFEIDESQEKELQVVPKVSKEVDDARFKVLMKEMISGKSTLQEIKSDNKLSETQHNALKVIEDSKGKKK